MTFSFCFCVFCECVFMKRASLVAQGKSGKEWKDGKEFACKVGDLSLILELGRSTGEGNSYPFQYSGLENILDYTVQGVPES